jgi:hypothetical protein
MGQRMKFPLAGVFGREWSLAMGTVVLGAGGAIASQTGARDAGFTVVKTGSEAGRYTVTFDELVSDIVLLGAHVIGAADAAYTNTAGGAGMTFLRNKAPTTRTVDVQFTRSDTSADAEITDNFSFQLVFAVKAAGA